MDLILKNKYALVTGGGRGIGRAIALALAEEGCNVAICALEKEEVESAVKEIKSLGVESLGICSDIMKPSNIKKIVKKIADLWGAIDILVNNVGGGGKWVDISVEKMPENTWEDVYKLNALSAVNFTMATIPLMKKQKWGRVVTIASMQGREGGGRPWYNMAKSAEISLMKTLSTDKQITRCGITFNSIAPGPIMFSGNERDVFCKKDPKGFAKMVALKPLGRLGKPEEIGSLAAFLCSEKASLINGACIPADGGESRSF